MVGINDVAPNWDNEIIHVNFYELVHFDGNFKSECPVCNEMLVMFRDNYGQLLAEDRCVGCGQRVVYDDIELVKLLGGW